MTQHSVNLGRRRCLLLAAGALGAWGLGCRERKVASVQGPERARERDAIERPEGPVNRDRGYMPARFARHGRIEGLALGQGQLAQRVRGGVRIWNTSTWKIAALHEFQSVSALGALANGDFVVIGKEDGQGFAQRLPLRGRPTRARFAAHAGKGFRIFYADPLSQDRFWLLDRDQSGASFHDLSGRDGSDGWVRSLGSISFMYDGLSDSVVLGDGSFVSPIAPGLQMNGPASAQRTAPMHRVRWDFPDGKLLAPGPGADSVWAASRAGELRLIRVRAGEPARTERTLQLGGSLFQLDAAPGVVAALQLLPGEADSETWSLRVVDEEGRTLFGAEPPPVPPVSPDDRAAVSDSPQGHVLANRSLRADRKFVALGGPERLSVWDVRSGKLVVDQIG